MKQSSLLNFFSSSSGQAKNKSVEKKSNLKTNEDDMQIDGVNVLKENGVNTKPIGLLINSKSSSINKYEDSPVKINKNKRILKIESDSSSEEEEEKNKLENKTKEKLNVKEKKIQITECKIVLKDCKNEIIEKSDDNKMDLSIEEFKEEPKQKTHENDLTVVKTTNSEYLPNKENYHPINDACWSKNESTPYMALANTFNCMEQTSKRLELISILCNYFRSVILLSPKDLVASVYLCLNKVSPDYEGLELGIGETILFKALAQATGRTLDKLKNELQLKGDIGLVAQANRCNQRLIFVPKKLTVQNVFSKLKEIASLSGNASQTKKCDLIRGLLVSCDAIEAKFLLRSLSGKLRIGLAEQSALTSLANAFVITPPQLNDSNDEQIIDYFRKNKIPSEQSKKILDDYAKQLKYVYYQCPNYEIIISAILKYGFDELAEKCKLTPGIPLKPMLAYPTNCISEVLKRFENIEFTCEYKYDGERAQIHILENGNVQIYSRNSENNTSKYPDVINIIKDFVKEDSFEDPKLKIKTAIIDGEVVAYDTKNNVILPFQILSTRKRKDANASEIKIEVCIFAFDLIYLNGDSLIDKTLRERRELLFKYFPQIVNKFMHVQHMESNDIEHIQEFLDKSIKDGCEGLMIKTLDGEAHYEISKRSHNWLKLKKDYLDGVGDTLDLVVIGGYLGTGKRTGVYGGYLLACYDEENEEFQTICKIGTGFKDEDLEKQFESLSKLILQQQKPYYRVDTSLYPDHWFESEQVWEVKCADFSLSPIHTAARGYIEANKGISLRFPRFLQIRADKKPEDATSAKQVSEMYRNQQQLLIQNEKLNAKNVNQFGDDEEFDL